MKQQSKENYLEKIPVRSDTFTWTCDGEGIVTLEIENKGVLNRIFQKLLKKPKISYIHLDKLGSFIWQTIDGKKDLSDIAELVEAEFGDEAHPLYERLIKYIEILKSYNFIRFE